MRTLEAVMRENHQLGAFGFGVFNSAFKTPQERSEELFKERVDLRRQEDKCIEVAKWLTENLRANKAASYGVNSYGLKHVVEKYLPYSVNNGVAIAAALMAGYPISRPDGPNVQIGIKAVDYRKIKDGPVTAEGISHV